MVTVSKELQQTLQAAVSDARKRRHEYVTLEHLLHALCADKVASEVLVACSGDLPALTRELDDYLTRGVRRWMLLGIFGLLNLYRSTVKRSWQSPNKTKLWATLISQMTKSSQRWASQFNLIIGIKE